MHHFQPLLVNQTTSKNKSSPLMAVESIVQVLLEKLHQFVQMW